MTRARYFAFRTAQTVVLLWLIMTLLFVIFRLMPGDFTTLMLQQGVSAEQVEAFEQKWGLNDPLGVQYINYMMNVVQGDFGTSLQARQPVLSYVGIRVFNSFILVAPAITAGYIIGSVVGTFIGNKRGAVIERVGVVTTLFFGSLPSFFLAILLILIFAIWLNWLPTSGMMDPATAGQFSDAPWWRPYLTQEFALHYILPGMTLALRYANFPTLIMRTSVIEVLNQNFVYYNRVTGLSRLRRLRHLAKHASLPVITVYPISIAQSIGGVVLVEVVFNWPGIGNTLVQSVLARDFPVLQFIFFAIAAGILIGNFVVDIVYGIIDPRVSVSG